MSGSLRDRLLRSYYRLKPGCQIYDDGHQVQIRRRQLGDAEVTIRVDGDERWMSGFLRSLTGEEPLERLLRTVPVQYREECLKLTAALRREYLLEDSEPFTPRVADDWKIGLFPERMTAEHWYRTALEGAHVLVIGAGALGSRVAAGLVQIGVGAVTVADDGLLTEADKRLSHAYAEADAGTNRGAALVSRLRRMKGNMAFPAAINVRGAGEGALEEAFSNVTFAILACDAYSPRTAFTVNRLALERGVRWSMLLADGWDVYIGPTFLPGQTGCYLCLEEAFLSDARPGRGFIAYRDYLLTSNEEADFSGSPAFADTAAGMLLADLPNLLGHMPQRVEDEASLTLNRRLKLNFRTFDADLEPLIRFPRCKACGALRHAGSGQVQAEPAGADA